MSIKRFDGSNWVDAPTHKRFDGSNWVDAASVKRFDGSNWIETAKNVVSPTDNLSLYYQYTAAHYTYHEYKLTCQKCGKKVLHVQQEVDTGKYMYIYNKADGIKVSGIVDVPYSFYIGIASPCLLLRPSNYNSKIITKQQYKNFYNESKYPYTNYNNMRYHENGSTRNLFTSDGYLICPWCE